MRRKSPIRLEFHLLAIVKLFVHFQCLNGLNFHLLYIWLFTRQGFIAVFEFNCNCIVLYCLIGIRGWENIANGRFRKMFNGANLTNRRKDAFTRIRPFVIISYIFANPWDRMNMGRYLEQITSGMGKWWTFDRPLR